MSPCQAYKTRWVDHLLHAWFEHRLGCFVTRYPAGAFVVVQMHGSEATRSQPHCI